MDEKNKEDFKQMDEKKQREFQTNGCIKHKMWIREIKVSKQPFKKISKQQNMRDNNI